MSKHFEMFSLMEPVTEQSQVPSPETADQKRPKILSVSQPEQPKLSKPRILTQIQTAPQKAIQASAAPAELSAPTAQPASADPRSEADWTEQTLSQAERDAEEQRMANDVTQAFTTPAAQPSGLVENPKDGQASPKTEPKSVHGVLYAIKGFADSVSRKLAGK